MDTPQSPSMREGICIPHTLSGLPAVTGKIHDIKESCAYIHSEVPSVLQSLCASSSTGNGISFGNQASQVTFIFININAAMLYSQMMHKHYIIEYEYTGHLLSCLRLILLGGEYFNIELVLFVAEIFHNLNCHTCNIHSGETVFIQYTKIHVMIIVNNI